MTTDASAVAAIAANGQQGPAAKRKQRLLDLATLFDRRSGGGYYSMRGIEHMTLSALEAAPTNPGQIFGAMGEELRELVAMPQNPTVGDVMAALNLTQPEANYMACFCANGETTTAERIAL